MRAAAALGLLLLAGCAARAPKRAEGGEWHVHVNTDGKSLGAYTLVINYDARVAVIESIESCAVRRFRGTPEYDPETFTTGETRVTSLDAFPRRAPDEDYHLLRIAFRRIAAGALTASAKIEKLYGRVSQPIEGVIRQPRFERIYR